MNFEGKYRMAAAVTWRGGVEKGWSILAQNMTRTLSLKELNGSPIEIKSTVGNRPADTGYAHIA